MLRTILITIIVPLLLGATAAHAKFTTGACLVQKHIAWDNLRNCQRKTQVKQLKGKPADFATCQTKFQDKFAKINDKATKAAIACRYRDNGDHTVTDYDTGLQWEQKVGVVAGGCVGPEIPHCVNATFSFSDAELYVNASADGSTRTDFFSGFADYSDWRLPTIMELQTIVDASAAGCGSGSPCIDPIFGPTVANLYWSATTFSGGPGNGNAWDVDFFDGSVFYDSKFNSLYVRAVRTGL